MKRVIVCGGRDYDDRGELFRKLDGLDEDHCFSLLISGGARGADCLAEDWAYERSIPYVRMPANWRAHKKSAGPRRNQWMIDLLHPELVIAFPGGNGTADMVGRAKRAGIQVFEIPQSTRRWLKQNQEFKSL